MKKVVLVFVVITALFLVGSGKVGAFTSPLESPVIYINPNQPVIDDELRDKGVNVEPTPQIPDEQNQSIDLDDTYGNMLNLVQQERLWPVGEPRYDGCVALSDGSWICP